MRLSFLGLMAALFLAGCAQDRITTMLTNEYYPAKPDNFPVQPLTSPPSRAHVEIAYIEAAGSSRAEVLEKLKSEARKIGADAIILDKFYEKAYQVAGTAMTVDHGYGIQTTHGGTPSTYVDLIGEARAIAWRQ